MARLTQRREAESGTSPLAAAGLREERLGGFLLRCSSEPFLPEVGGGAGPDAGVPFSAPPGCRQSLRLPRRSASALRPALTAEQGRLPQRDGCFLSRRAGG